MRSESVTTGERADRLLAMNSERPELAFVLAPRQNLFFVELVEALRAEAQSAGARASLHVGNFPAPRPDLIYVLVTPREYFTIMHGRVGPPPEVLRRTVFICAEQPDTAVFEENVLLARRAGAVFDLSRSAVQAFARDGIAAHHLQIGWTQGWDHLDQRERDIDVLFMGAISERRARALSRYAQTLWPRRVCYVLSEASRPNWMPSESFRTADEKWDLLNRSKILLNIHHDEAPYFEWLRIAQAMANGAVVVSEHSADHEPLLHDDDIQMGTLKKRIEDPREIGDPNVVKVVTDRSGNAIYFSRSIIPYGGTGFSLSVAHYKHIGLYVYRRDFLLGYSDLPVGPLEQAERLEQLRALENGYSIRVVETEYESLGVDTPEDLERVSKLFEASVQLAKPYG